MVDFFRETPQNLLIYWVFYLIVLLAVFGSFALLGSTLKGVKK